MHERTIPIISTLKHEAPRVWSDRTQWNFTPNALATLLAQKRAEGDLVLDLTQSNPLHCNIPYPETDIAGAFSRDALLQYHPSSRGLPAARSAISEYYRNIGVDVRPEQIVLTAGTSDGYTYLLHLICNAGDRVLLARPRYPLFDYVCQLADVEAATYDLRYDGSWSIDFESLRRQVDNRTKAIILVQPNNPTGSFVEQGDRERLVSFAGKHGLALIVDEVFLEYTFQPGHRRTHSFAGPASNPCFVLNGLSKLIGLPQLKLSWIIASGPRDVQDEALGRLEVIADTYLSVNSPVQVALPDLLKTGASIREQIRSRLLSNYALLRSLIPSTSSASVLQCDGGWSAVLQLPATLGDEEWAAHLLRTQDTLVHPGHFFDLDSGSFAVVSLLTDPHVFSAGIRRLVSSVQTLGERS